MLAFEIILIISGIVALMIGLIINNDPISLGLSYLAGNKSRPGTIWIVVASVSIMLGIGLVIRYWRKLPSNNSDFSCESSSLLRWETGTVSGIIAIITLGTLLIAGGSVFIFIGIQLNNAFRHAWDFFTSYWSFGFGGSDPGKICVIIGVVAALIGISFIVIGILEAVKRKTALGNKE